MKSFAIGIFQILFYFFLSFFGGSFISWCVGGGKQQGFWWNLFYKVSIFVIIYFAAVAVSNCVHFVQKPQQIFPDVSKYCLYWFISSLHVWIKSIILSYNTKCVDANLCWCFICTESNEYVHHKALIAQQFLNLKIYSFFDMYVCIFGVLNFACSD